MLDIAGSSVADGTPAFISGFRRTDDQKWQVVSVGGLYYRIINKLTGKALGVAVDPSQNGAAIEEWGLPWQRQSEIPSRCLSVQIAVSANILA